MRLYTPEIAWHQTLPIYSCDLQPVTLTGSGSDTTQVSLSPDDVKQRQPLGELTSIKEHNKEATTACPPSLLDPNLPIWCRLATAGGDNVVRLWRVALNQACWSATSSSTADKSAVKVSTDAESRSSPTTGSLSYLASLRRHEKPVNVVRWSPKGDYLASAGDDRFVLVWARQSADTDQGNDNLDDEDTEQESGANTSKIGASNEIESCTEKWFPLHSLRRHLEDIYDVAWAPDLKALVSGSVDQSVILWPLHLVKPPQTSPDDENEAPSRIPQLASTTGQCVLVHDHKHYVQGVAYDPLGVFYVSLSSDRSCRVYRVGSRNCIANVVKWEKQRLFQDDSWKSFFRRPAFSPDGLLLVCPSGNLENVAFAGTLNSNANNNVDASSSAENAAMPPQHAAHLFSRTNFSKPVLSLPTGPRPVVGVRFCPQPFHLRLGSGGQEVASSLFDLPYRWLFCLVLEDGVLFYDTQHSAPFAQTSQLHYQALNDVSWSQDGHLVALCSTDGYCSFVQFAHGELGSRYYGPIGGDALALVKHRTTELTTEEVSGDVVSQGQIDTMSRQSQAATAAVASGVDTDAVMKSTAEVEVKSSSEYGKAVNRQSLPAPVAIEATKSLGDAAGSSQPVKRRVQLTTLTLTESAAASKPTPVTPVPTVAAKRRVPLVTLSQPTPCDTDNASSQ